MAPRGTRKRGSKPPLRNFSYHSEQIHSDFANGYGQTRRNIVSIRNGKGEKAVELYNTVGARETRRSKRLSPAEIRKIRAGTFIPGLFGGSRGWRRGT